MGQPINIQFVVVWTLMATAMMIVGYIAFVTNTGPEYDPFAHHTRQTDTHILLNGQVQDLRKVRGDVVSNKVTQLVTGLATSSLLTGDTTSKKPKRKRGRKRDTVERMTHQSFKGKKYRGPRAQLALADMFENKEKRLKFLPTRIANRLSRKIHKLNQRRTGAAVQTVQAQALQDIKSARISGNMVKGIRNIQQAAKKIDPNNAKQLSKIRRNTLRAVANLPAVGVFSKAAGANKGANPLTGRDTVPRMIKSEATAAATEAKGKGALPAAAAAAAAAAGPSGSAGTGSGSV